MEVGKQIVAIITGLEPHQVGIACMLIAGVLIAAMPVDWIKRR